MTTFKKFIGHLKTVNKHRFTVCKLCFHCGLYWQGLTHDLSKYSPVEFINGVKFYTGTAVSLREPFEKAGIYWGYVVRVCEKWDEIFNDSIYGEKYDFIIGTSDKGENYQKANFTKKKDFKHCLIVFGGIQGIEGMLEDDEHNVNSRTNVRDLFDLYLNTCMGQGLRTIRTEEAIMISLAVLRPELDKLKE